MKLYKVYLGRNIPGGGFVDDGAMKSFLEVVVSPIVPAFTAIWCDGYWDGVKENCVILELIGESEELRSEVNLIAKRYKETFQQDAVLVTVQNLEDFYLV